MTEIYFVRHAQSDFDNTDETSRGLSEKGMRDREKVTVFLADKNIDVVLSSPYKRAVDTVKDFADKYGYEIEIIKNFRERDVAGRIEDYREFCRRQWSDLDYKLPDSESLREVQQRYLDTLRGVLSVYRNKNIAVGCHGTALAALINYYDKTFGFEDWEKMPMPWIVRFEFEGEQVLKYERIDVGI